MSERRRSCSSTAENDVHQRNNNLNGVHQQQQTNTTSSGVNSRNNIGSSRSGKSSRNSGLGMRRSRPSLAIKAVNFSTLWESLERDLWKILCDPLKAKLTHDIEQLHNIVYKLSTCQCYELPDQTLLALNPHATVIPQEGDIQPYTLYFMFKKLISRFIQEELIGKRLKDLRGIAMLKQYSECWKNFVISCEFINKVFHYLNTDWINDMECKRKTNRQSYSSTFSDKNTTSLLNLKLIKHFSESNHVCHTRTTCYLLWRELFFERCDSNSQKNIQDIVNIDRHFYSTSSKESPRTQDLDENSPLLEEVVYFDKYLLYHTILQEIEKDRNVHSPMRSKSQLSSSVDEYYPILKSVIRSLVDLSLDIEEDYYFNVKYLHLISMDGFNSRLQPFIGDYYNSLFSEVQNDHCKGGSKKRVAYYPLFYTIDFERFLLQKTVEYYTNEVSSLISELLISSDKAVLTYIKHTLTRIEQESNKIILHYINASSKDVLTKICVDIFVEGMNIDVSDIVERSPRTMPPTQSMSSSKDFLFSEIDHWMNDVERFKQELELLFKVIMKSSRKNAFNVLSSKLRDKVLMDISNELKSKFENCAEDDIDSILFIEIFIENYLKFGSIVKNIFGGNFDLNVTKDKAFKEIFNNPPVFQTNPSIRSAESLARYTNHLLKATSKTSLPASSLDDYNFEDGLDRCVMICTLLNDMDVFVQFYKVFLSRRLLIFSSESDTSQEEIELSMINKLKKVCPFSHIYKIQTSK